MNQFGKYCIALALSTLLGIVIGPSAKKQNLKALDYLINKTKKQNSRLTIRNKNLSKLVNQYEFLDGEYRDVSQIIYNATFELNKNTENLSTNLISANEKLRASTKKIQRQYSKY